MATLYGWAIAIGSTGADHTYVTSSDGYVWPCWGRSAGGRVICSGTGSSAQANCLSQTNSHAGIIYAVTGVCHQTANRILYPARVIVSGAGGYWASVAIYGTYGTRGLASFFEWEARKRRCSRVRRDLVPNTKALEEQPAEPMRTVHGDERLRAYLEKVEALYQERTRTLTLSELRDAKAPDFLGEELELMSDFRLNKEKQTNKIGALRGAQAETLKHKAELDEALINKSLTPGQYAKKVNHLVNDLMAKSVELLGKELHKKLFDIEPGMKVGLVDPDILAKYH